MIRQVADCKADLLVVIAFGQKVSRQVIDLQKYGAVNVHGSLLPKYRGAAPIHWAMINGEPKPASALSRWPTAWTPGRYWHRGKFRSRRRILFSPCTINCPNCPCRY